MSSPDWLQKPKALEELTVLITNFKGDQIDISAQVVGISIFEGIYQSYVTGDIDILDNTGLYAGLPVLGQESLEITIKKRDDSSTRTFYVTEVTDVVNINNAAGGFKLHFISQTGYLNSSKTFSRHFSGFATDIISKIYKNYLSSDVEVSSKSILNINTVLPWMHPGEAVDMLIQKSYTAANEPLFLFETLWSDKTCIKSYTDMINSKDFTELSTRVITRSGPDFDPRPPDISQYVAQVESYAISHSYPLHHMMEAGIFAKTIIDVDLATKTIGKQVFDYTKSAPVAGNEWVSGNFYVGGKAIKDISNAKIELSIKSSKGYSSANQTVDAADDLISAAVESYRQRMHTIGIMASGVDPVIALEAGGMVEINWNKLTPVISDDQDVKDALNSGQFIIVGVHHRIETLPEKTYSIGLELAREGIGQFSDAITENKDEQRFNQYSDYGSVV